MAKRTWTNAFSSAARFGREAYKRYKRISAKRKARGKTYSQTSARTVQARDTIDVQKEASRTHTTIVLRKPRYHKNVQGAFSFLFHSQNSGQVTSGKQAAFELAYHGHINDQLLRATTTAPHVPPGSNIWSTNPFAFNPFQATTGSALSGIDNAPYNDRILFRSVYTEIMLVNESVGPVYIDLYWVTPRSVLNEGPVSTWTNMLSYTGMSAANAVQPTSFAGNVVVGKSNPSIYGEKPEYCKPFSRAWRTLRKKRLIMQAGATHKQTYTVHVNKILERASMMRAVAAGEPFLIGTTVYCFAVLRPAPALIREGANLPANDKGWTTMTNQTGWVTTQRYKFQSLGTNALETNYAEPTFVSEAGTLGTNFYEIIRDVADDITSADLV